MLLPEFREKVVEIIRRSREIENGGLEKVVDQAVKFGHTTNWGGSRNKGRAENAQGRRGIRDLDAVIDVFPISKATLASVLVVTYQKSGPILQARRNTFACPTHHPSLLARSQYLLQPDRPCPLVYFARYN